MKTRFGLGLAVFLVLFFWYINFLPLDFVFGVIFWYFFTRSFLFVFDVKKEGILFRRYGSEGGVGGVCVVVGRGCDGLSILRSLCSGLNFFVIDSPLVISVGILSPPPTKKKVPFSTQNPAFSIGWSKQVREKGGGGLQDLKVNRTWYSSRSILNNVHRFDWGQNFVEKI